MSAKERKNERRYPEHLLIKKYLNRGDIIKISKKLINPQNGKKYNESYIGLVLNGHRYNRLILEYAKKVADANKLADEKLSEFETDNKFINE